MIVASLLVVLAARAPAAQTQRRPPAAGPKPACETQRALRLVREQLSEAKAFESGAQRALVLTRAAELLWAYDEAEARALLTDAFEAASAHYRERGPESIQSQPARPDSKAPGMRFGLPDPRVIVVHAVARRDPAWARELAARAAEETQRRADEAGTQARPGRPTPENLVSMAPAFLEENPALALSVAREALRLPPADYISNFIYVLAKFDRAAADAFWADALQAYSGADASKVLLLSAYPFGFNRNIGLAPGYNAAGFPPPDFTPSRDLQREFVAAFMRVAERRLAVAGGEPPPPENPSRPSEVELIYAALTALEGLYGPADKGYAAASAPLKQAAAALLSERAVRRAENGALRKLVNDPPADTGGLIDRVLEAADKLKDPDMHDRQIVMGLQPALRTESVERLEAAALKVKDEIVRRQFLDIMYSTKAFDEVRAGRLDEAARLAEKLDSFEQRAALTADMATSELKLSADPAAATRTASLAESVSKSAQRAPESEEKARALVMLAHVYGRIDPLRAPAVLSEAVAVINRLPGFDITRSFATRPIEGRTYNYYPSYPLPVSNLPGVLRELAARDFETALALSGALDDRYRRALAVVALASRCLEDVPKPERPAPKPTPAAKRAEPAPKPPAAPQRRP
jgi:hypothetical protein